MTPLMPGCQSHFTQTSSLLFKLPKSVHFLAHFMITKFSSSKFLALKHGSLCLLKRKEPIADSVSPLASFKSHCPVSIAPVNQPRMNYPSKASSVVRPDHAVARY